MVSRVFCIFAALCFLAPASAEDSDCYTGGSIAASVIITLIVILALQAIAFFLWKLYWNGKSGQHLVLIQDPEKGESVFAFDNPGFKEGPSILQHVEKDKLKTQQQWNTFGVNHVHKGKVKAMDDSYTAHPQLTVVPLRSHDFTGLGFDICGNMRDGIYIKDVRRRGPASESGGITQGDRIVSIKVSFEHMVFEDALTILSYASPYELELSVHSKATNNSSTILRTPPPPHKICHPFYRSQSISDLHQIIKSNSKRGEQPSSLTSDSSDFKPSTIDRKVKIENEKIQNERNFVLESVQTESFHEIELEKDEVDKGGPESKNVKSYLVKGIQNLKEKLHSSLHIEENKEEKPISLEKTKDIDVFTTAELIVPDEVEKAGNVARESRKSVVIEDVIEEDPVAAKRNKRKAPVPPQDTESLHDDSESESGDKCGTIELNSSHITVHQSPQDNESRKASSLGDLSRYEADSVILLERAVSLDLGDGAPGKKRKAPIPPQDDCLSPYKEARLENGTGSLKKSSVWGTLEEIMQNGSDSETDLGISGCSTPEKNEVATSTPYKFDPSSSSIQLSWDQLNGDDTPPDLPTSPVPTLSTFVTEIQVASVKNDENVVHFESTEQLLDHMAALNEETPETPPAKPENSFSKENMSDEQILALKASPRTEPTKPARTNVTITTIKTATPSRIPVRAGAKSPGTSLSPASGKRSVSQRNGHSSP